MSRAISLIIGERLVQREMPEAHEELLPGVLWGDPWTLFTPAYWLAQAWMTQADRTAVSRYYTKGDLVNELGFCMLGGFGITAELATAAFVRCRDAGLFDQFETRMEVWQSQLSKPFFVNERSSSIATQTKRPNSLRRQCHISSIIRFSLICH